MQLTSQNRLIMRVVYLLLFMGCVHTAMGQGKGTKPKAPGTPSANPQAAASNDPCKQIRKDVSEDKVQTDLLSPSDPVEITPVVVKRTVNTDSEWAVDNFIAVLQVAGDLESIYTKSADGGQTEKQEKHVVIEFDDNSKIVDDTVQISHDVTEDKTQAIRIVYFPITDENAKSFTTKKIARFSIAGYERSIPADSAAVYRQYFECVKNTPIKGK